MALQDLMVHLDQDARTSVRLAMAAAIARLHRELVKALRAPEMRDKLVGLGCEVIANKPEELAAFFRNEMAKWTKVIKESGARVE